MFFLLKLRYYMSKPPTLEIEMDIKIGYTIKYSLQLVANIFG